MKKFISLVIVFFAALSFMALSPATTGYYYGCTIYFSNVSSHNVYAEFDFITPTSWPNPGFGHNQLCLEKNDVIAATYSIHTENRKDIIYSDPNYITKEIRIYDIDSGNLLKEITLDNAFIKRSGSLENGNAVFEFDISDAFLTGGE